MQLSDVVAGFFGKHFDCVQDNSLAELKMRKAGFSKLQRENIALLREIIDRSDMVSNGFLYTIIPLDGIYKNNYFLYEHDAPRFIA
ncbi:MAG: hypothetical protein AB3X44_14820 [Leptothrix sp. (in: b-proteobacteria)]